MPQTLVQHGIIPALREMSDRINQSGQVTVRVNSFDIPERLSEVEEISLYRATQEWVNNIIKYAKARVIEIQFVGHDNEIAVMIEDDGMGFDSTVMAKSKGNGWKNIKSRINLIKGSVELDTTPSRQGTTLIFRVPVLVHKTSEPVAITLEQ
jgi:signal transduction histidine kinase